METGKIEIFINGEQVRNFSAAQKNYVYTVARGESKVPEVTAFLAGECGKRAPLKVTQAENTNGTATVDGGDLGEYTVTFRTAKLPLKLSQMADVSQVELTDGFWKEKTDLFSSTTVTDVFNLLLKQGALRNFERAAAGEGKPEAFPWHDGLLFETIAAAGDFLRTGENPELEKKIDGIIDTVYRTSLTRENGYLSTHAMLETPGKYFDGTGKALKYHDCYNFGCMAEAAVHYYKATKKIKLLFVAVRYAEFIVENYGYGIRADGDNKINMVPSHSLSEESMLELYTLLRDEPELVRVLETYNDKFPLSIDIEKYADVVKFWIENKGNSDKRINGTLYGEYAQDDRYYFDQTAAEGHAVRANLFYTGMAAAGREFRDLNYLESARIIWDSIVGRQMYITGGVGATEKGEAYGPEYDLPNDGYCETCAQVAMAFFGGYLSESFESSAFAETVETQMYNGILGGISLDGEKFYYTQPLNSVSHRRWSEHDVPCCPPMLLKFYSTLANYIYSYNDDTVYVNQFVSSRLTLDDCRLTQQSGMPYSGATNLSYSGAPKTLKIRLPEWTKGKAEFKLNGSDVNPRVENGYAVVQVENGDSVSIMFDMSPRRVYADSRVEADRGRVAFARGPLIYCIEGIDNPELTVTTSPEDEIAVPVTAPLTATRDNNVFEGKTVTLVTRAAAAGKEAECRLIPFYLRDNRGESYDIVWAKESR